MDTKQITKLIVGVGRGRIDPPELTTNKAKTPIVKDTRTGEIVAKCCRKCSVVKLRKDMATDKDNKDGMKSNCLNCMKGYSAGYYANPENKKRHAEYKAEYYSIPKNKKRQAESKAEWSRNNPDKKAKSYAKRNARKRNLPSEDISSTSFEKCVLTGATDNVHIEHMIPLVWGHGGTIPANCYAMEGSANKSKRNKNPFEWYESHGERYGITSEAWNGLIEDMANRNGMTSEEFESFVYWCEANKRTLEQIKADNKRYNRIVDSVTLYRDSMAKQSETTAEPSRMDVVPV